MRRLLQTHLQLAAFPIPILSRQGRSRPGGSPSAMVDTGADLFSFAPFATQVHEHRVFQPLPVFCCLYPSLLRQ